MIEIDKLVRKNILELVAYSSARDEFSGKEGIFLDANENPFGNLNRYPDPYQIELKKLFTSIKEVELNQVFVGNGSDEVIDLLCRIFCIPGKDKILTFYPTYGMYDVSAAIHDVELVKIPLKSDFSIDVDKALQTIKEQDSLKLIFICSPNNPTGNVFAKETIEKIIQNTNAIVVVDEAYIDFCPGASAVSLINKYPNLVISQTMSKAYGLAAARVGFAISNSKIISLLNKVKAPYNVSILNQQAAIESLKNKNVFQQNIQLILEEKQKLIQFLSQLESVDKVFPSDANFLLVQFKNSQYVFEQLIEQKIIVRNRSQMIENCIRITVGSPLENQKLITILKEI